ncbi:MAG: ZIP family metal transporter [Zoogloea sp.]|nr:ZIP family metal transporter [Zoogloea sp.]
MTPFVLSMLASLAGGLISVTAAAVCMASLSRALLSHLVSYAIGALLGAAFLEILPHAIRASESPDRAASTVLGGILVFFLLEKLVLWRHCHEAPSGHHLHAVNGANHHHEAHGRSGMIVIIGDSFHNFVDGMLIAAAFMESVPLGLVTAAAIVAHEIPQELGDFVVLLHSGYSRGRAFAFNLLSSVAMALGALLAYAALPMLDGAVPVLLALACSSMIYVAVADLIPGLHRRPQIGATAEQAVLICAGILSIAGAHHLVEHYWRLG